MKFADIVGCIAVIILVLSSPQFVLAHHSFAAEFDENDCRDFNGVFSDLDWQNPHAYFRLDVTGNDGTAESWTFQTYALITLKRAGMDRSVLMQNIGEEVWVRGCVARNGRDHYAAAGLIRLKDGVLRQIGQIQN